MLTFNAPKEGGGVWKRIHFQFTILWGIYFRGH